MFIFLSLLSVYAVLFVNGSKSESLQKALLACLTWFIILGPVAAYRHLLCYVGFSLWVAVTF